MQCIMFSPKFALFKPTYTHTINVGSKSLNSNPMSQIFQLLNFAISSIHFHMSFRDEINWNIFTGKPSNSYLNCRTYFRNLNSLYMSWKQSDEQDYHRWQGTIWYNSVRPPFFWRGGVCCLLGIEKTRSYEKRWKIIVVTEWKIDTWLAFCIL